MANEKENQGAAAPQMQLIIDRARWLRGTGDGELLRKSDGRMCCLGFLALECGYAPDDIQGQGEPGEMATDKEETIKTTLWLNWLLETLEDDYGRTRLRNSDHCGELIRTNDDKGLPEELREEHIAEVFAKHGVTVEFVGEAAPAAPKEPQP